MLLSRAFPALLLLACTRGAPPEALPASGTPSVSPLPAATQDAPEGGAALAPGSDASLRSASRGEGAQDAGPEASPDPSSDPGSLPQTRDRPSVGPAFDARARALWDAIVHDDPERAMPFFFPVSAYRQVKAIPRPELDWKHRLIAAYARDIHALHRKLGAAADQARLVRVQVPEGGGRWVEPDEETNKLGYYRVYGTRIIYESSGRTQSFEVKSLISWRGEWYVVHLSGFK